MELNNLNTASQKLDMLVAVKTALCIDIEKNCLTVGIDPASIDDEHFDASTFKAQFPESTPTLQVVAIKAIARNVQNLVVVNKKIEELQNV